MSTRPVPTATSPAYSNPANSQPAPSSTERPYYANDPAPQGRPYQGRPYQQSHLPSSPPANATPGDQCGALDLQWLIGRLRTEIPVPVDVSRRRVTCTQCAITEDHVPYRLNIFYDRQTGRIQSVRCG
ncbi:MULTISPECIES: hypothetical protein [unclassified Brevundimonas]|uniref:hypothetical protein n=1 Tax=unclassified Brevundimonas TaxID=2622653 RepID=UPI0025C40290|nr:MULTISPECIES: hypothetical protein [unclassified Brevundimonas]